MAYVMYWQGLSFSAEWNNTESQGATVPHRATGSSTGKWHVEMPLTKTNQVSAKHRALLHLLQFCIFGISLLALLRALLSFLSPPFPPFSASTVTLSLSPWLCYSACLISRSLIGWLPAPREIPFSLPPTRPPTHPPSVRKCERSWWKLIVRAGVLAPVLDVTAGRGALSSLFTVWFGFRQGFKHGMLPSGTFWHTAPLSGFPAPGKCLFISICCHCHLVWVLLRCCVCVCIFKCQVK